MLINTFLASLAAKIAMGTGLAVATAGAAGVLPKPAQKAVATVVEATTPFSVPAGAKDALKAVEDLPTDTTLPTVPALPTDELGRDDEGGDDEGGGTDVTRKLNHGACVSTVAKNTSGPGKGKTVSSIARSDCGKTSTSTTVAPTSSTSSTSTTVPGSSTTTSSTVDDGERSANSGPGSANRGKGNSANNASSGKGNSGKK